MAGILEQARAIRAAMDTAGGHLTDGEAVQCAALYRSWEPSGTYAVGDLRRRGENLYRCLTAHQGQSDWPPDVTPSLWVRVDDPAEAWPEWRQPTGATDAYPSGAKVSHGGKHWVSTVDANVWEPGVYGWTEAA